MTTPKYSLAAAIGAAITTLAVISTASAATNGSVCQTWNPSKASPAVTHCVTWSHEAAARMRAANCDPAMMSGAAMRAACDALTAA